MNHKEKEDDAAGATGASSDQRELIFVDYSDPKVRDSATTKRLIRQHVMKDIGKARHKAQPVKAVELDLNGLQMIAKAHVTWWLGVRWQGLPPPIALPVDELDYRGQELLAGVFRNAPEGGLQMHLRDAWFTLGLKDAAPLFQILANSALYESWSRLGGRHPVENYDSIRFQSQAVAVIQKEIRANQPATLDAALGAVTGLMAYQDISGNREAWIIHHNGSQHLVKLRGGVTALEKDEELRVTLSWCELRGAFVFDIPPVYPLPSQWLSDGIIPKISAETELHIMHVSAQWMNGWSGNCQWLEYYREVAAFSFATFGDKDRLSHPLDVSAGSWTNPVIHRSSTWRPRTSLEPHEFMIEEAVRFGTALYLSHVWRFFGVVPTLPDFLARKLKELLSQSKSDWGSLWNFKLWALYMAGFGMQDTMEEAWFYGEISKCMLSSGLTSWDDMLAHVQGILWFEQIFSGKDHRMRVSVEKLLQSAE